MKFLHHLFFATILLSACQETANSQGPATSPPSEEVTRIYSVDNLPTPKIVVRSRKTWNDPRYEGASIHLRDNFVSTVVGDAYPGGRLSFEWHFNGTYRPDRAKLTVLHLALHRDLGFQPPAYERICNQHATEWSDETYHVEIDYERKGNNLVTKGVECVANNVPPDVALQMRFLTNSFQDIAIGIVSSGEINRVPNENLRSWLWRAAMGEVQLITRS